VGRGRGKGAGKSRGAWSELNGNEEAWGRGGEMKRGMTVRRQKDREKRGEVWGLGRTEKD